MYIPHICDWCGSPHKTEKCYRRDPMNMVRYPLQSWPQGVPPTSSLQRYNKTYPRDPTWYRTATLNRVRSHLQKGVITLKDINGTYDSDLSDRSMSSTTSQNSGPNTGTPPIVLQTVATEATNTPATYIDPHGDAQPEIHSVQVMHALPMKKQCLWCTMIGHSSDKCYARDPDNLKLFPNRRWHGKEPDHMTLKFNKKYTQEEAQKMIRETPPRATAKYHQAPRTPSPQGTFTANPNDRLTKATDWLTGIIWCISLTSRNKTPSPAS
jgi:hypothetical protein